MAVVAEYDDRVRVGRAEPLPTRLGKSGYNPKRLPPNERPSVNEASPEMILHGPPKHRTPIIL